MRETAHVRYAPGVVDQCSPRGAGRTGPGVATQVVDCVSAETQRESWSRRLAAVVAAHGRPFFQSRWPETGRAPVAFRVRRDAHGQPVPDCFILHRRRHRQTCLPGGLRSDRRPQRHPERLRPRKRALAAVAIGRRRAGAGQRRPVRRARAVEARCTSDRAARSTSRSPRSAGSGAGPAATTSCRTRHDSPRRGCSSAPTRWCSTPASRTVQLDEARNEARRRRDRQGLRGAGRARRAQDRGNHARPGGRSRRHRRRRSAARTRAAGRSPSLRSSRAKAAAPKFLLLANAAVSTAGDAERFVIIDGHRYSHIINPSDRTGRRRPRQRHRRRPRRRDRRRPRDDRLPPGPRARAQARRRDAGAAGHLRPLDPRRDQDVRVVAVQRGSAGTTRLKESADFCRSGFPACVGGLALSPLER